MSGDEIVIRNALGVCSVEEDTRILAQVAADVAPAGGHVLDLGTGTGYVAIYLAQRGLRVDAVDISSRALALARENIEANRVSVNLLRSDMLEDVRGPYDVIAFNPPMNPGESELTRVVTSFLRRHQSIANWLMNTFDRFFDDSRVAFLVGFLDRTHDYLTRDGCVVLEATRLEIDELAQRMTDLDFGRRVDIPRLPTEQIVVIRGRREIPSD